MEENKIINEEEKMNNGDIDKDVLDTCKKDIEEILKLGDSVQIKRIVFNAFCEFLSTLKELHTQLDTMNNTLSVCSADKLDQFFVEVNKNLKKEEKRQKTLEKVHNDHKKTKSKVVKVETK